MSITKKKFSKEKWLESAYAQMEKGILTQREIDDACDLWVNAFDGKTRAELEALGKLRGLNRAWFA